MTALSRRSFLVAAGAALAASRAQPGLARTAAKVVVIGGGFGGASLARTLKRLAPDMTVTLVERDTSFVTCPFSNGVLGGLWPISKITHGYDGIRAAGITVVHDTATAIDPEQKRVRLAKGDALPYDFLVVSPGIQMVWDDIEGYDEAASEKMPHAWLAGAQTVLLRRQLEAMRDGGLVVMAVPAAPYRCPPGPYERICLIADYLKAAKPKSKILVLDAKDSFAKQDLFEEAWKALYPGMIEWVPGSQSGKVMSVDVANMTVSTGFDDHKADVANIIPAQKAGQVALSAGLDQGTGYCAIDPVTFESRVHKGIYVLGDATIAGAMPKSGFSANQQAKACAAAILASIAGTSTQPTKLINVCYSLANADYAFSIADVFDVEKNDIALVAGSGLTTPLKASAEEHRLEAQYAHAWYDTITSEMFG